MTSPWSRRSFGPRLLALSGVALLAALPSSIRPAGQAAPAPPAPPATWPKTTPAHRSVSAGNLKQIALALHNYHDVFAGFPGPAITDKAGRPLLSWRVAILPFIEEDLLYRQFRLDEAWDGPNNKKLLEKMPRIYGLTRAKGMPTHATFYRVFTGPDAAFDPALARPGAVPVGRRLAHFTDGTSNTVLVAEAGEAVAWTRPDELAYDARKPLPKLGGLFPEGFHVAMADGSVKFLSRKVTERVLRAMITPAGGEAIDWEKVPLAKAPAARR